MKLRPLDSGPDAQAADPSNNEEGSMWIYQNKLRAYLNSAVREFVTLDQTQSLTNKTIGDTNTINAQDDAFTIDDAADATLQIDFNAAGTTSTKTTITSSQTANRVVTIPDATDTLVGKATTDTLTNKTITSAVLNDTISGTSIKDEDTMVSDSASHLATQQSIKAYVDASVTAQDLDTAGDSGTGSIDLDSQSLTVAGGTGITSVASGQTITVDIDSTVATLSGSQSLTNKTIGDTNIIQAQDDAFEIRDAADATLLIDFDAAGTTGTKTTITSSQTANRVITLPDATSTLISDSSTDTLTNKTVGDGNIIQAQDDAFEIRDAADATLLIDFNAAGTTGTKTTITSSQTTDRVITLPDATSTLISDSSTDTLTNKTIDADGTGNSITNIEDANIKTAAAIDATKIANGTVTNTEFQYVGGVTSDIQTQINTKLPTTITTTGDVIYSSAGTTASRLAIGSPGEVLTVTAGIPSWEPTTGSITAVTAKTANYTVTTSDFHVEATANTFTFTLYAVASNSGRTLTVSNTGAGVITIDPNAAETFNDGSTAKYLSQDQSVVLECNGSEWLVKSYVSLEGYIKDVRATSTGSGGATSGSWETRVLNTSEGDASKFSSVSTNVIALEAGTYHINGNAAFFATLGSVIRFRNTSDGTTDITGVLTRSGSGATESNTSTLEGTISITTTKNFELQSRVQTSKAANGFGTPQSDAGSTENETYASIKIIKVV